MFETFLIFPFGRAEKDAERARARASERAEFLRRQEFPRVAVGTSNISVEIRDI